MPTEQWDPTATGLAPTGHTDSHWRPSSQGSRPLTGPSLGRGGLGAGLVEVPRVPYRDPSTAVLDDPVVAENKRFCSHCASRVGRSDNGVAGLTVARGAERCPHHDQRRPPSRGAQGGNCADQSDAEENPQQSRQQ